MWQLYLKVVLINYSYNKVVNCTFYIKKYNDSFTYISLTDYIVSLWLKCHIVKYDCIGSVHEDDLDEIKVPHMIV